MASWDMGYQADIQYITCYVRDMSPVYLNYIVTSHGFEFPQVDGNFKSCELGFGQGLSIDLHAASAPGYWFGNDFNPSQVGFAQDLAHAAGLTQDKVLLVDDSFEELLKRDDLPKFDFIGLHGIWSWISPENQQFILDFVKKNLKEGGFLYVSYNCSPGYTHMKPVRELMLSIDKAINSTQEEPEARLEKIGELVKKLVELDPRYMSLVPRLRKDIEKCIDSKEYQYVYAEYYNQFWDICHEDVLFQKMATADLSFLCQSNLLDDIKSINLSPEQLEFFDQYKETSFAEDLYNFLSNKGFRMDIFHRGARKLSEQERESRLNAINIVLVKPLCDLNFKLRTRVGDSQLEPEKYGPIYQLLSDHKVHSIGEVKAALHDKLSAAEVEHCIAVLLSQGTIDVASDPAAITDAERKQCLSFNQYLFDSKLSNIDQFASPVTGGGVATSVVNIKLLAIFSKLIDPESPKVKPLHGEFDFKQIASDLIEALHQSGQELSKDGEIINNPEQALNYAVTLATKFKNFSLPLYRAMGVI